MFFKELPKNLQNYIEELLRCVKDKKTVLYLSEERKWGKTTIINELGLILQSLGYRVYGCVLPTYHGEYCVEQVIDLRNWEFEVRGIPRNNFVILVDEVYSATEDFQELLMFCNRNNIPMVGFVNYRHFQKEYEAYIEKDKENMDKFKREYLCKWCKE